MYIIAKTKLNFGHPVTLIGLIINQVFLGGHFDSPFWQELTAKTDKKWHSLVIFPPISFKVWTKWLLFLKFNRQSEWIIWRVWIEWWLPIFGIILRYHYVPCDTLCSVHGSCSKGPREHWGHWCQTWLILVTFITHIFWSVELPAKGPHIVHNSSKFW